MRRVTRLMYIDHETKWYKLTVPDDDDFRIRQVMTINESNDVYAVVEHREEDDYRDKARVITIRIVCDTDPFEIPEDAKYLGTIWHRRNGVPYHFYQMPWPPK